MGRYIVGIQQRHQSQPGAHTYVWRRGDCTRLACARDRRETSVLSHAIRVHRVDGAEKAHAVRPTLLLPILLIWNVRY